MNLSGNCLIRLAREALNQEKRICTSDKEPTIASVLPRLLVVCDDYALNTVSISCTHTHTKVAATTIDNMANR
jgi:hypothetical protein